MIIQPDLVGIRGIVFDLDGTLVDSNADIARAVNAMLREHGRGPLAPNQIASLLGEGAFNLVAGVHKLVGLPPSHDEVSRNTARYLEFYRREPVRDSTLFADARQALEHLRECRVRLGVCTNKNQRLALQVLDTLGVLPYFAAVVGGDQLPVRKPDPEHLLATVRLLELEPDQVLYVGDSPIDVECARRAGVRCGVVAWSDVDATSLRLRRFMDLVPMAARPTADSTASEVQR